MIEKSFYLLRTNPALTTNIKVVVTSEDIMYLESYSANRTLTEQRFKHVEVNTDSWLFEEIPNFFRDVPAETGFLVKTENDEDVMYDDFANQFDDFYFSGAAWTEDTSYEEEYEYTAPIWIKKDALPEGFIILRVDGPGLDDGNSPVNFRPEFLDKWKIVEYIDLTENSAVGSYIRKNVNHDLYPNVSTEINFEDLRLSVFNGIDYSTMGYVSKSVDLEPYYKKNTPIFQTEEFFTNQWRDLGVIFPYIWNLKFLFDDTPATPTALRRWSLNRYVGFYVDTIEEVVQISPYQPFDLNKVPDTTIQSLTLEQVTEIPYVLDNLFVQDVGLRRLTVDPILGGWIDGKIYYVEWLGKFYNLEKTENDRSDIIGKYLFKIISSVNIEYDVPTEITNPQLQAQYKKVLINEISTLKNQIEIVDSLAFENITGSNIIEHTHTTYTTYKRNYYQYVSLGKLYWSFTITLDAEIDNNLFSIANFSDADLNWIELNGSKYTVKQYTENVPNIGGKYYIHTDDGIRVNKKTEEIWINDGINTKNSLYYNVNNIENVPLEGYPIWYSISRVSLLDIKDFDFDRVETDYAKYEYEKEDTITESLEPKLYAKDRRTIQISIEKPQEILETNFTLDRLYDFLSGDPNTYLEWLNQYESTHLILDENDAQMNFSTFTVYARFKWHNVINNVKFSVGDITYNDHDNDDSIDLTFKTYQNLLPLYINPTRIAILDSAGDHVKDPVSGDLLWKKDWKDEHIFTEQSAPKTQIMEISRDWYREEGYKLLQEDEPTGETKFLDFYTSSEPKEIKISYPWNDPTNVDPKTNTYPMAYEFEWAPYTRSATHPNQRLDTNYMPVSSEYITSEELWEIVNNNTDLSPIWSKNQYVCKWGYLNSIGHFDYPYRLNYDLEVGGLYNMDSYTQSNIPYAVRQFRDLDYFYRFGLTTLPTTYKNYSLHLKENYFDVDKYLTADFDYFDWLFKSDQLTTDGLVATTKYSIFNNVADNVVTSTLFKGVNYSLFDVNDRIFNDEYLNDNLFVIEDYVRTINPNYADYKFSITLGRKLSTFVNNPGDNDGDFGIDIYLNDKWKNCVINLYFETDLPITFYAPSDDGTLKVESTEKDSTGYVTANLRNLETAIIDELYDADTIISEDSDLNYWELGKISIDGKQQIGDLRIRDIKLLNFLSIINDPNYEPVNGEGRRPTQYVHVYESGEFEIYDAVETDFVVEFSLPEDILVKEKTYAVSMYHENALEVNNTIKNRIILDDDPNNPLGNANYTSKGALVNSIIDENAWDGYPFARVFSVDSHSDTRAIYELNAHQDPTIQRYSGPYTPIFKNISIFRPSSYWTTTESATSNSTPALNSNNWKFYDDYSDGLDDGQVLTNFGYIDELLYSKVNSDGNILKLSELNNSEKRSIYPIVDEYGYDTNQRYIFQSTWDRNFYLESRKMELPINEYPGKAGYSVFFDGVDTKLLIEDTKKFNIVPNNYKSTTDTDIPVIDDTTFLSLNLVELVPGASMITANWTRGYSGIGDLEYDGDEQALKYTNISYGLFEFNSNIRVKPSQTIEISFDLKVDTDVPTRVVYAGYRKYGSNYNGSTDGDSNISGSVGSNSDSHKYIISNERGYGTYTTYTGTYTSTNANDADVIYARPLILLNYSSDGVYTDEFTTWIKNISFKYVDATPIQSSLNLLNLDLTNITSFSLINSNSRIKRDYTYPDGDYNYLFSDDVGFINAFNINSNTMSILSESMLEYSTTFYDIDKTNMNGHQYSLIAGQGVQEDILASAVINSDISNGTISLILDSNTRGIIPLYISMPRRWSNTLLRGRNRLEQEAENALGSDVGSSSSSSSSTGSTDNALDTYYNSTYRPEVIFELDQFKRQANQLLQPDYELAEVINNNSNLSYKIQATTEGPEYNFTVRTVRNSRENYSKHINSPQETTVIEYSNIQDLTYISENEDRTNITNIAITSFTIEFWIKIDEFTSQNETILHKGSPTETEEYSWIIRRYENTDQLEFVTRSYVLEDGASIEGLNTAKSSAIHKDRITTTKSIEDNLWHHVACVFNAVNNSKEIYIDAVRNVYIEHLDLSNIVIDSYSNSDSKDWPISIASNNTNGTVNFAGNFDELRLWNYARTKDEIYTNYNLRVTPNAYLDPFKSLVGYWYFDEQLGSPIFDYSVSAFEIERIETTRTTSINDGNQIITNSDTSYKYNEQSLHDQVNINQTDVDVEWQISGAEILGLSDERYETTLPPSTTYRKLKDTSKVVTPRSRYLTTYELPIPTPAFISKPKSVKVIYVKPMSRKIPIYVKPLIRKPLAVLRPMPAIKTSLISNKIDKFSKIRKKLEIDAVSDQTSSAQLTNRIATIQKSPVAILKKEITINRAPALKTVTLGKNTRGVVSTVQSYYNKPMDTMQRRTVR